MARDCVLPELGENIATATVVELFIKVGDVVEADQGVLSLETDKAEFELPSPAGGKVTEILVGAGDDVAVGQLLFRLEDTQEQPDASEVGEAAVAEPMLPDVEAEPDAAPDAPALASAAAESEPDAPALAETAGAGPEAAAAGAGSAVVQELAPQAASADATRRRSRRRREPENHGARRPSPRRRRCGGWRGLWEWTSGRSRREPPRGV